MYTMVGRLLMAFSVVLLPARFVRSQEVAGTSPGPAFETVSIRPSVVEVDCFSLLPPGGTQYAITCVSLRTLIAMAWKVSPSNVEGNGHALEAMYDVRATTPEGKPWTQAEIPEMMRAMLKQRFGVEVHKGSKQVSGYELYVAKGGPKLKPAAFDGRAAGKKAGEPFRNFILPGAIEGRGVDLMAIASLLSVPAHATVVDETGIAGVYNIDLHYAPENSTGSDQPNFFTAVEEQLGLKLKAGKVAVDTVVVDRADEEPTPN